MELSEVKANSVEELFGTLQQSIIEEWRHHLKTSKYSKHMALDEFYKEMPEMVDKLIEDYIGAHEKLEKYVNNFKAEEMNALEYLVLLKDFCKQGREDLLKGDTELESDMDEIISFIDGIIYKVRELKESKMKNLTDFLYEAQKPKKPIKTKSDKVNKAIADMLSVADEEGVPLFDLDRAIKSLF